MKNSILAFLAFILTFGVLSCQKPSYGLKSKAYKRTQSNIKHHGKAFKPYQKENVFQKGFNLIRK
jgi:hypothetical protein